MIEQHYGQLPNVPHPQATQPTLPNQPISHLPSSLIRLMIHLTASPAVGDLMSRCQWNQRVPDFLSVHCSFLHSYCQRIYFNTNFCYHFCFYCAHFFANCFDLCDGCAMLHCCSCWWHTFRPELELPAGHWHSFLIALLSHWPYFIADFQPASATRAGW